MKIKSPVKGNIKSLESLKDGVFSEKMLGEGLVIEHQSNVVCAPVKGKLSVVFDTGHAYGITCKDGTEVLIHIGVDTVNLKGNGFEKLVKKNQKVKVGTPLVELDLNLINKEYSSAIILVITNESKTKVLWFTKQKKVLAKEDILEVG